MKHVWVVLVFQLALLAYVESVKCGCSTRPTAERVRIRRQGGTEIEVKPSCPPSDSVCRVKFNFTQLETMMIYQGGKGIPIVIRDGTFMKRINSTVFEPVTQEEMELVNQGNGEIKLVYMVNDKIPGPPLVVYSNQTIEVTVLNNLLQEGTGIHWHGLFQRDTPWMDGVTSVTQCPINMQETFVYRFQPDPAGTQWYHSHTAFQRGDGLFGPFIILPEREDPNLPPFEKDYIVIFMDWHQLRGYEDFDASFYGYLDYLQQVCPIPPTATVINGKGIPDPVSGFSTRTTYPVQGGRFYRLRFLNVGVAPPYLIQIQEHKMVVIASDGSPLKPFPVDGLIVDIAERFDVFIKADQSVDNYWITFSNVDDPMDIKGYAILHYEGADTTVRKSSEPRSCNRRNRCVVANCPKETMPGMECINIGDMRSTGRYRYFNIPRRLDEEDIEDHFLVFGFTEHPYGGNKASINARHFVIPSKPPQVSRTVDFDRNCDLFDCDNNPCLCTHMITLTKGKVIQMVFASARGAHPVHMHGHDYQVVKVVYGPTDRGVHSDINCRSNNPDRCTNPTWTNPAWLGGNVPGINTEDPPEKDTVIVPGGGYVVLRFLANNPGWWMLHCHIERHLGQGMGLIMQEGQPSDMKAPPKGFPTCGSFRYDEG